MTNLPVSFSFHEDYNVRIVIINDQPWFVAQDVCDALQLTNSRMALKALDNDEKGVSSIDTLGGKQSLSVINESGLYTLILRCRDAVKQGTLPHRFRKWVTNEVLPTIRKTGSYNHPTAQPEFITNKEMDNLKRLIWCMSGHFRYKDCCSYAIHKALRKATNIPSPNKFTVESLPALAEEIRRIYRITDYVHDKVVEIEKRAMELIRNGEDISTALLEVDRLIDLQRQKESSLIFRALGKYEEKQINDLHYRQ